MECIVEFDYIASQNDELTIMKGDIIKNVISFEDGWKKGNLDGKEGVFPDNFVRVIKFANDLIGKKETTAKLKDQFMMNFVKDPRNCVTDIPHNKNGISQASPLLGKKNFLMNILPNNEKKRWSSNGVSAEQHPHGKSDTSKSEPSKPIKSPNKGSPNAVDSIKGNKHVIVIFDYKAENPDELELEEGEIVTVLDRNLIDEGWWRGIKNTGEIGIFPSNFVQPHLLVGLSGVSKISQNEDDANLLRIMENGSIQDQSNISASISFNDLSMGRGTPIIIRSSKEILNEKSSTPKFKTKNVCANSCSMDSLSEITKSRKSQDLPIKSQNTIYRFRHPSGQHETSKGDDTSNSMERNFQTKTQIRCRAASPSNNEWDFHLLKSEFDRFRLDVDQKISKLSMRIQTLVDEIDEEKKQRAASEIELVRLRRVVHMLDAQSLNGIY